MAERQLKVQLALDTSKAKSEIQKLQQQINQANRPGGGFSGGGSGFPGLPGGGSVAGFATGAMATAFASFMASAGAEMSKLGARARELAQSAGNANSQLGQLRSALERQSIRSDINATAPGIVQLEKFKADWGSNMNDFLAHSFNSKKERAAALQEKFGQQLGGQNGEEWQRMKQSRLEMEQDIALAQQALQTKTFRAQRDFSLEQRRFNYESATQIADLNRQAGRQQFDQAIAVKKFQENFQAVQSQKAFNLSQKFALAGFQQQQGYQVQDYNRNLAYQNQDFQIHRSRSAEEFGINRGRQGQDYQESMMRAVMGGANGMDLFWMSRDFSKAQARQLEDFNRSQRYAGADLALTQSRDRAALGISLGRGAEGFGMSQQQALANRQLEVEAQKYNRAYEGLELQTRINRESEDMAINFQKLNAQLGFQREGFANRAADMSYDQQLERFTLNLQTGRQRRNMTQNFSDFAGKARIADELGAAGLGSRDADFSAALADNARRTGQTSLFQQINDAWNRKTIGGQLGDAFNTVKQIAENPIGAHFQDIKDRFDAGVAQRDREHRDLVPPTVVIQAGNNTFNLDPGFTASIQQYIDEQNKRWADAVLDIIKKNYGY